MNSKTEAYITALLQLGYYTIFQEDTYMNPEDFTAQAQDKMKQVQQLTEDMQRAATRGQDSIAGMKCQIADMNNKILDEQKNIDRVTADYRSKIDAASQEAQRLNTQAAELAQKQADDAARAAM